MGRVCQYRKFFAKNKIETKNLSFDNLKDQVIKEINNQLINVDCIWVINSLFQIIRSQV